MNNINRLAVCVVLGTKLATVGNIQGVPKEGYSIDGTAIDCRLEKLLELSREAKKKKKKEITEPASEAVESSEPQPEASQYNEEELYLLSHLIMGEASVEPWEVKIGVGSVVLNRVSSGKYPNTLEEVIFQNGQYACTWDGNFYREPSEECVAAAKFLLDNGSQFPNYVLYQAQFVQGDSIYFSVNSSYGTTYFCYNSSDVQY